MSVIVILLMFAAVIVMVKIVDNHRAESALNDVALTDLRKQRAAKAK